jgi:hypothetical protein
MDFIDYSKYSVEELEDAYKHIDREKWPDRVKEIESILIDPVKRQLRINTDKYRKKVANERHQKWNKKHEPLGYSLMFVLLSILASFFGIVAWRSGHGTHAESLAERVLYGAIFIGVAYINFRKWRKKMVNESKTNKLINKDKKQLAVFVPQHFSQQFFAHY